MKNQYIFLLVGFTVIMMSIPVLSKISIDPKSRFFVDEFGRARIFHGFNIVPKQYPYIPDMTKFDPFNSLTDEDVNYMKSWGTTMIRLGVIWEALETKEGEYNMEYLNIMEQIVNKLGSNGIYVLLDSHQDDFSRLTCGEGVPVFYAKKINTEKTCDNNFLEKIAKLFGLCKPFSAFNLRYDNQGLPLIEDCLKNPFGDYSTTPEFLSSVQALYTNENFLLDRFTEFWKVVLTKFKDNKYIAGLDLWNEPAPGNMYHHLDYIIPGRVDNGILLNFYKKIDVELRKIDPNYIIMFEPAPVPDTIPIFGGIINNGFTKTVVDGDEGLKLQVLNEHSYCCLADGKACKTGEPNLKDAVGECRNYHQRKIKKNSEEAKKLGIPLLLTEFGACKNSEACFEEITSVTTMCDKTLTGWMYWAYKSYGDFTTSCDKDEGMFDPQGNPQQYKVKAIARPYVIAYQGVPISFDLDKDYAISAKFVLDLNIKAPTEVYFNQDIFYKKGYSLNISIDGKTVTPKINTDEKYIYKFLFENLDLESNKPVEVEFNLIPVV